MTKTLVSVPVSVISYRFVCKRFVALSETARLADMFRKCLIKACRMTARGKAGSLRQRPATFRPQQRDVCRVALYAVEVNGPEAVLAQTVSPRPSESLETATSQVAPPVPRWSARSPTSSPPATPAGAPAQRSSAGSAAKARPH